MDKNDNKGVPVGAVTRDCSPEGRHIYVIRAEYDGFHIAGNYEEGNDYAEFEEMGIESSKAWEFLVSNKDVAGMKVWIQINHKMMR